LPFVNKWGASVFGDSCRECGYRWGRSRDELVELVRAMPASYAEAVVGRDGWERSPELKWPLVSYVCHVGDNLRIWAERLVAAASGSNAPVGVYDDNLLAQARNYIAVPLTGAI
jgi:hypothetical protein